MRVVWDPLALDDWHRLAVDDARAIAAAVVRWSQTGEGLVHAADGGEYLLYVGERVVLFFLDDHTDTMHVWHIRRA